MWFIAHIMAIDTIVEARAQQHSKGAGNSGGMAALSEEQLRMIGWIDGRDDNDDDSE